MDNKQLIEKHVAKLFLERTENILISDDDLLFGDHLKNEPDILYKEKGIEIGAVLRGTNTHIDNYEKEFLYRASEAIKGKIPETLQIRLVMQDDNGTVEHTPSAEFQGYKHLPKYLDGIFIYQSENRQVKDKVVLINEYNSLNIYEGIYFLDFSMYALNSNFDLVNFSGYSPREPSKFLHGYDEIRVELRPIQK